MQIYAATKDLSFDDIRTALGNLVQTFETDAAANRQRIRVLQDKAREHFYTCSVDILRTSADSRGAQYLLTLLIANGTLLRALCDPNLTREEALALGRAARRVDSMIDISLAQSLANGAFGNRSPQVVDLVRLMDILSETADAARIMPSLMRMMRHPDDYLRSKAAKMIGRGSHSAKWVMARLSEPDPRVRANAIESLWGVNTPDARELLTFAINDANNRVACNAALGLYYLGEVSALAEVVRLAGHESGPFRAAAAWVMGETADPRFSEALRRMISDPDPMARKRAFTSLALLKAANAQPPVGTPWHVAAWALSGENFKGLRRVVVSVAGDDLRELPRVAPLHFLLNEGGQYVTAYKVTEKPLAESLNVVFVIPRSREAAGGAFLEGVLSCLKWKRHGDSWSLLPYIETGDGEVPPPREPEAPSFTNSADALAAALRDTPRRLECTDLWTAVWCATRQDGGLSRGKRQVIICSSREEGRAAGQDLLADIQDGRIHIQAVSSAPNGQLEEFCRQTRAWHRNGSEEEAVKMIEQAYLSLLSRFEIAYQPVAPSATALKVRLQAPGGWGETLVALGQETETAD